MRVLVLDTKTGETAFEPRWDTFDYSWWTSGNGSCDCNRQQLFDHDAEGCRSERYLVIGCDDPETTFDRMNDDYPAELRDAYRHRWTILEPTR